MGSPGNPAASMMARSIIDNLASRGSSPTQGGSPSGAAPEMAGDVLSQRMSELQGADPQMVGKKLNQMKQEVVQLIPQIAFRIPGMSKHLSGLLKSLDGALKEIEQANSTQGAVQKVNPIGSSMASPTGPTDGAMPGPGGPMPGM